MGDAQTEEPAPIPNARDGRGGHDHAADAQQSNTMAWAVSGRVRRPPISMVLPSSAGVGARTSRYGANRTWNWRESAMFTTFLLARVLKMDKAILLIVCDSDILHGVTRNARRLW